jgi:hypothetical protein
MTALLKFECRPAIRGYRVASFDRRKFSPSSLEFDEDDNYVGIAPTNATDDEMEIVRRAGVPLWTILHFNYRDHPEDRPVEFLLPNSEKTRSFNLYDKEPSAHLALADTPQTSEGVMAFANTFGPLKGDRYETLDTWFDAIRRMRNTRNGWIRAEETGDFTAFLKRAGRGMRPGITAQGVYPFLEKDETTGRPRLCLGPENLLDALWLQLAIALDRSESLQACVECGKWFAIKSGRGRSDKEFCSDACRMRAYRRRKGSA